MLYKAPTTILFEDEREGDSGVNIGAIQAPKTILFEKEKDG